jgi:hypothetical protein
MFWKKMINFCKNENCPSSSDLLAFQNDEVSMRKNREISRHLKTCEFCQAEAAFYYHYPPTDEKIETAEMPKPLYDLALALLGNRHNDFSTLNKMLGGNESLKLEKVS